LKKILYNNYDKLDWEAKYLLKYTSLLVPMVEIQKIKLSLNRRLKKLQEGILKVISKGPYEEGLLFKIIGAKFEVPSKRGDEN